MWQGLVQGVTKSGTSSDKVFLGPSSSVRVRPGPSIDENQWAQFLSPENSPFSYKKTSFRVHTVALYFAK